MADEKVEGMTEVADEAVEDVDKKGFLTDNRKSRKERLSKQDERTLVELAKERKNITDNELMRGVGLDPHFESDHNLFIQFMSTRRGIIEKHHKTIAARVERQRKSEQRQKVEEEIKKEKQVIKDSVIKKQASLIVAKKREQEQMTRDKRRNMAFGEDVYAVKDLLGDEDIPLLLYGILKELGRLSGVVKSGGTKSEVKVKVKKEKGEKKEK